MVSISRSKLVSEIAKASEHGMLNHFIYLMTSNGVVFHVLFTKTVLAPSLLSIDELPISTPEFSHRYLYEGQTLIGSLIASREKFTKITHNAITYLRPDSTADFVCPTESDSSGIYLMTDGHGSFSAVVAFPSIVSDLVVQDKEI